MTDTAPPLKLGLAKDTLPTCTPYLMPFHIDYSGPAPVSTYFRVKPAPAPTYGRAITTCEEPQTAGGDTQLTAGSSQSTLVATSSSATLDSSDVEMINSSATPATPQRFVAAFRGRTVQGLQVELPQGYSGLIVRTPDAKDRRTQEREGEEPKGKAKNTRRRNTRRSAQVIDVDVVGVDAEPENGGHGSHADGPEGAGSQDEAGLPARVLQPSAAFSSFVLWHQDTHVDEGRDEYLRSLTEWTRLAAEIHREEDVV